MSAAKAGLIDRLTPLEESRVGRLAPLDAARGVALLSMLAIHFVPTVGDGTVLGDAVAAAVAFVWDKCAGTFCLVAGIGWALHPPSGMRALRRAACLGVFGIALWVLVWPTEILTPLACMMLLVQPLLGARTAVIGALLALVLAAVPITGTLWFDLGWSDWATDGTHAAGGQLGWATLRYFVYSGTYPLLPWVALPMVGILFARGLSGARMPWIVLAVALPSAIASHAWREWSDAHWHDLPPLLLVHDSPATLPYFAVETSWALLTVSLLVCLSRAVPRSDRWLWPFLCLGRTSLTHYVLHIVVAFGALRWLWPGEDWSVAIGVAAFVGYAAFAVAASMWWLRHHRRGPLESLWARAR